MDASAIVFILIVIVALIGWAFSKQPKLWDEIDEIWDSIGKTDEITVTLDRLDGIYQPGETVGVTVKVQPREDMKLTGAQVRLRGTKVKWFEGYSESYFSGHHHYESYSFREKFYARRYSFLGETTLPRGISQRYDIQINLPEGALSSSTAARQMRVKWQISVELYRPFLLPGLHAKKELYVRTPAHGQTRYGTPLEPLDD